MRQALHFPSPGAVALALALAFGCSASLALGTDEQRLACTGDVFRLCSSDIPNVDRIVACLRREKASLSAACQAVFSAEPASATRTLAAPQDDWCVFRAGSEHPDHQHWRSWCGGAARTQ